MTGSGQLAQERWVDDGGGFSQETVGAVAGRPLPAGDRPSRPPYTCLDCGHVLRVSGLGRHRVYFEPDDERSDHPVVDRVCPQCEHALPGKNPR